MNHRYEFYLCITADQYLDYYRGTARHVVVRCTTGQTVQFPAGLLQQFVTTDGKGLKRKFIPLKTLRNNFFETVFKLLNLAVVLLLFGGKDGQTCRSAGGCSQNVGNHNTVISCLFGCHRVESHA
jgi:hypothetical protein